MWESSLHCTLRFQIQVSSPSIRPPGLTDNDRQDSMKSKPPGIDINNPRHAHQSARLKFMSNREKHRESPIINHDTSRRMDVSLFVVCVTTREKPLPLCQVPLDPTSTTLTCANPRRAPRESRACLLFNMYTGRQQSTPSWGGVLVDLSIQTPTSHGGYMTLPLPSTKYHKIIPTSCSIRSTQNVLRIIR